MTKQTQTQQQPKKSYTAPKLITFGGVRTLTRGGTGSTSENTATPPQAQPKRRP